MLRRWISAKREAKDARRIKKVLKTAKKSAVQHWKKLLMALTDAKNALASAKKESKTIMSNPSADAEEKNAAEAAKRAAEMAEQNAMDLAKGARKAVLMAVKSVKQAIVACQSSSEAAQAMRKLYFERCVNMSNPTPSNMARVIVVGKDKKWSRRARLMYYNGIHT